MPGREERWGSPGTGALAICTWASAVANVPAILLSYSLWDSPPHFPSPSPTLHGFLTQAVDFLANIFLTFATQP